MRHFRRLRPLLRQPAFLVALVTFAGGRAWVPRVAPRASSTQIAFVTPPRLGDTVTAPCQAAAQWWRTAISPSDSGQITVVDTILVPPLGERPRAVCLMRAWLPHSMRKDQPAWEASGDSVPADLRWSGGDWRRLIEYHADGPDGNLSGYQRGLVRCTVAQSWDGGDDGDSTYVAEPRYWEELTCWSEGGVPA